jgi:hypothetical protein
MEHEQFSTYLRRRGRSPNAIDRCVRHTLEFLTWLEHNGAEADKSSLIGFLEHLGTEAPTKTYLWALAHYFDFEGMSDLAAAARELRRSRIESRNLAISEFAGIEQVVVAALAENGIRTADQMVTMTGEPDQVAALAAKTGIPEAQIVDLRETSRFSAIRGIGSTRSSLYRGCVGSIEELSLMTPEQLIAAASAHIERTRSRHSPPTPREAAFTIEQATQILDNHKA